MIKATVRFTIYTFSAKTVTGTLTPSASIDETGYSEACSSRLRLNQAISTEESVVEIPKSGEIGI